MIVIMDLLFQILLVSVSLTSRRRAYGLLLDFKEEKEANMTHREAYEELIEHVGDFYL